MLRCKIKVYSIYSIKLLVLHIFIYIKYIFEINNIQFASNMPTPPVFPRKQSPTPVLFMQHVIIFLAEGISSCIRVTSITKSFLRIKIDLHTCCEWKLALYIPFFEFHKRGRDKRGKKHRKEGRMGRQAGRFHTKQYFTNVKDMR